MAYSVAFFEFQLLFASHLASKFHLRLEEAVYEYTTFRVSFGTDDWPVYSAGLEQTNDPVSWTYQWYLDHRGVDPKPDDSTYEGHPLFGCLYFSVRDATVIRPHFIKNDFPGLRPLSRARIAVRQDELRRMFAHIRCHVPEAQTVRGNSWMYNLEAYRRLYPPQYTATLPISEEDEFQYLALWGQCFDRDWNPKVETTQVLLQRIDQLDDLTDLRFCFPYQIRQPECSIAEFYAFYGIS